MELERHLAWKREFAALIRPQCSTINVHNHRAVRFFIVSVITLLLLTALAKFISACGNAGILKSLDPVLGVTYRTTLVIAAGMEVGIALALLLFSSCWVKFALICATATSLILYRLAFWAIGSPQFCPCLGTITDSLVIPRDDIDLLLKAIIGYLFVGSLWGLFGSSPVESRDFEQSP